MLELRDEKERHVMLMKDLEAPGRGMVTEVSSNMLVT